MLAIEWLDAIRGARARAPASARMITTMIDVSTAKTTITAPDDQRGSASLVSLCLGHPQKLQDAGNSWGAAGSPSDTGPQWREVLCEKSKSYRGSALFRCTTTG
ncbi:MAG: hypothetical protein QOE51_433 [Actinoplanes sp.]|jgi:hypothetical protein|nr:hypothetical protein [Actinoplanes sp.]